MKCAAILILVAIFAVVAVGQTAVDKANRQGVIELEAGRYIAAADYFEKAIRLSPNNATAHFNLGTAYFYLRRYDAAIDALRRAAEIDPASAAIRNQLGAAYLERGNTKAAIITFRDALRLKPYNYLAMYNLGCAYVRTEEFGLAVEVLGRAAHGDSKNAEIRLNLAYALRRIGRTRDAIAEMEAAVALRPTDAELHLFLGDLYLAAKDRDSATRQYSRLERLDPDLARRLYTGLSRGRVVDVSDVLDRK